MMPSPSLSTLEAIIKSGHVPAISYAAIWLQQDGKDQYSHTAIATGHKNQLEEDAKSSCVDNKTRFPASSLSKIVFTYLVLQLVKAGEFDLDEPLHHILQYERLLVAGQYPRIAKSITARHVLSHTTGLPNLGSSHDSPLIFQPDAVLGVDYSYSGEAFLYCQRCIESKMGRDLESLAREYVFTPLGMTRSTFEPPSKQSDNLVSVHTELGESMSIYVGYPRVNAAGSLLTTAEDFSKLMIAWLADMNIPVMKQAFQLRNTKSKMTCGLGWHLTKSKEGIIAYQFGENPNTRAFVAINITKQQGAVYFTNSENGMSIAKQIFTSPALPYIGEINDIYTHLHYSQSDEPGWQETLLGKIAEANNDFVSAKRYFQNAVRLCPDDISKQRRLAWFNAVHIATLSADQFSRRHPFLGTYTNDYNDKVIISTKEGTLTFSQFGQEHRLIRISETEFLPAIDQRLKITVDGKQMQITFVSGDMKMLTKIPAPIPHAQYKDFSKRIDEPTPGYMKSTASSKAKEREKSSYEAPRPSWRP